MNANLPTTRPTINEDLAVEEKSSLLEGKRIAYGISGSIAAVESVKIIRELRRHGAEVLVFPTPASLKFIGLTALEWASANPVYHQLSARAEHIHQIDGVIIAPATLNLLNTLASGLADSPLSTIFQSLLQKISLGKLPALLFPAMHNSLRDNPILLENTKKLKSYGVEIFFHSLEEGKLKIPGPGVIVARLLNRINKPINRTGNGLERKNKIFITTGAVASFIDEIRIISNRASGSTGIALARELYYRGFDVVLLAADNLKNNLPAFLSEVEYYKDFFEYEEKAKLIMEKNRENLNQAIFLAAVSDFSPAYKLKDKLTSKEGLDLKLKPNPKVIVKLKKLFPEVDFVIFKLETNLRLEHIEELGKTLTKKYEMVVINLKEELPSFKKYFFSRQKRKPRKVIYSLRDLVETLLQ